jgi:hypothetical protein
MVSKRISGAVYSIFPADLDGIEQPRLTFTNDVDASRQTTSALAALSGGDHEINAAICSIPDSSGGRRSGMLVKHGHARRHDVQQW